MEDHSISNSQITASSAHDSFHVASNARLNFSPGNIFSAGCWSAHGNDLNQPWLQVDFQEKVTVIKVATQGRYFDGIHYIHNHYQWVKTYSLSYSHNGVDFEAYQQFGNVKVSFDLFRADMHKPKCADCPNDVYLFNCLLCLFFLCV